VGGTLITELGQLRSDRSIGAKLRYLEDGLRNMDFLSLERAKHRRHHLAGLLGIFRSYTRRPMALE
jgi:hypothetical protein